MTPADVDWSFLPDPDLVAALPVRLEDGLDQRHLGAVAALLRICFAPAHAVAALRGSGCDAAAIAHTLRADPSACLAALKGVFADSLPPQVFHADPRRENPVDPDVRAQILLWLIDEADAARTAGSRIAFRDPRGALSGGGRAGGLQDLVRAVHAFAGDAPRDLAEALEARACASPVRALADAGTTVRTRPSTSTRHARNSGRLRGAGRETLAVDLAVQALTRLFAERTQAKWADSAETLARFDALALALVDGDGRLTIDRDVVPNARPTPRSDSVSFLLDDIEAEREHFRAAFAAYAAQGPDVAIPDPAFNTRLVLSDALLHYALRREAAPERLREIRLGDAAFGGRNMTPALAGPGPDLYLSAACDPAEPVAALLSGRLRRIHGAHWSSFEPDPDNPGRDAFTVGALVLELSEGEDVRARLAARIDRTWNARIRQEAELAARPAAFADSPSRAFAQARDLAHADLERRLRNAP